VRISNNFCHASMNTLPHFTATRKTSPEKTTGELPRLLNEPRCA
jgi:hypothetical protein